MPLIFAAEDFANVLSEADRLGRAHWRELYGDAEFLSQLDRIAELQAADGFAYFVARTEAGEVVGHAGFFLIYSPVHAARIAFDAFYYVEPAHRKHGAARKLLNFSGESLVARDVPVVLVSCLQGSSLGQMIQDAGYERASTAYRFKGD